MTEIEAIKSALKKVKAQQDNLGGFMDRFDIPEHWAVRKALEKQIPKQIDISKGESKKHYYCPVCYKWLTKMTNYCCKCGQKLDWSDEE